MYWRFIVQNPLQFYWEDLCSTYYLDFSFENHLRSQVLKDFSVENIETTPENFLLKFQADIYFSQIFNCGSIYTIYPQRGKRLVLFFFSPYFFNFFLVVSLTNTNIKKLGNIREVSILPKMIAWCPTSLRKSITTPLKFLSKIYFSQVINCVSIYILYHQDGKS